MKKHALGEAARFEAALPYQRFAYLGVRASDEKRALPHAGNERFGMDLKTPVYPLRIEGTVRSRRMAMPFFKQRGRMVVGSVAALIAVSMCCAIAAAQSAGTPAALPSALPIVGDPHDTRANNLVVLDSIVFLLGVSILGGVLVWWGLRIYKEK